MTKAKKPGRAQNAQNLANAIAGLADGTYVNANQAVDAIGAPRATLFRHLHGGKTRREANVHNQALTPAQYWQTSGPKFGPTQYPADQSIHWAGIGSGMPSPAPNRTQFGRTDMYAKCGSGRRFFRSIGSVFACRKPDKTSVEPLMKWDYPTRHFL